MATATYLGVDTTQKGDWRGATQPAVNTTALWGSEGILIVDANGTYTIASLPSHISMSETGGPAQYTWNPSSPNNTRGIQAYNFNSTYFAGTWYKDGTFGFLLTISDGRSHIVRAGILDYDPISRWEQVGIRDGAGGTLLASDEASGSEIQDQPGWFSFLVTGTVELEIKQLAGHGNAVISAILIDCPIAKTGSFFMG